MTDFGDIRSICNTPKQEASALLAALAAYNDKVPASDVISYIREIWGWCPATKWRGGQEDRGDAVLEAHKHDHPTLIAYVQVGDQEIELLRLDNAEESVQAAVVPIRKEALDLYWMPWAQDNDSAQVRMATWLLYACLADPSRKGQARAAVKAAAPSGVSGGMGFDHRDYPAWSGRRKVWDAARWAALSAVDGSAYEAAKNASLAATVSIMWSLVLHNFSERVAQELLRGL